MKKIVLILLLLTISLFLVSCGEDKTNPTAVFETSQGTIKIELFEEQMPITVGNFIKLAEEGFYDGVKFHRVISGFMIQGGDPTSKDDSKKDFWGSGGPGYVIEDEFGEGLSNARGTISMANAGPNTGGSQFFINVANNDFLDSKHPVFGQVTDGMDVVDKIVSVETGGRDRPVENVVIEKVKIV